VSETYRDVDASSNPTGAAHWQVQMSTWPAVRAYKEHTYDLLREFDRVLDIGCGPGVDLTSLPCKRAVGVDASQTMCVAAAERGTTVVRSDAEALSFTSGSFMGARADRVLQHVEHPDRMLREAIRVLAPGGRLVIADPDQESLVIELSGVRRSVLDRLKALRRDLGYRNGRLISQVPAHLRELGLTNITVSAFPLVIRDPHLAFGLPSWPRRWRTEGGFTDDELAEWDQALSGGAPDFVYVLTFLVVAGTKS
jgi:SAM-dependent methyltransferase